MHRGKGMKFVGDSRVSAERKPNIPKDYSEYPGKTEAFWPDFLLREWLVGAVFLIGFLCLTVAHPAPLEGIADPTETGYIPMPDWYFLFLYQLIKYQFASGPYNLLGVAIIPGLAFGGLLLAPFIDRGPERRPSKRPFATGFMLLAFAAVFYLTWEAVDMHDWAAAEQQGKITQAFEVDKEAEGYKIYANQSCINCHGENLEGSAAAPALVDMEHTPEEIKDIAHNGIGNMPAGQYDGSEEDLDKLAEYLAELKSE
ncbi:menaquinol-cytochrome c reductase cytochrome b/c subunit [Lederbergia lenta]|uniref:Menaquinol:cytochrome c reductase cytochrome c subunit n=1 Tax=Lederbergia lenta TaxID=1467 RepID=A0A2X4WCG4_LEDLE|nr:menaquinol-cytochrome c reductase cytochrome b/c subunit [Lederbergia lenta]MCM3109283.1 c-type cytochrome [Lederbergia lenta]MEC2324952.1 c-type cytochrome [Lederbergia lenta]SQI56552.1 menaquinol-cytochrome c reductase cytochrome b/c subunit [Lederbergia lenta]